MNKSIDCEMLRRYDRAGPRYTSYPTVPQFHSDFGEEEFYACAQPTPRPHAGASMRPLSLYVHVPFCRSPCFYCGCNRVITRNGTVGERYVERVLAEAQRVRERLGRSGPVLQFHLGGGTPNSLSGSSLERLVHGLGEHFAFNSRVDRDYSMELDPRSLPEKPEDYAARLVRLGFNRVSLGVQDFDEQVQLAVNRVQSAEQTLDLVDACRDQGIQSVNVDLIYGLPKQSLEGFRRTLRTVLAARPDRMAVYGYAHMPAAFRAQRRIHESDLPDSAGRLALLRLAIEELTASGYRHIGMDHFALPTDALVLAQERGELQRNFMGYTTHGGCDLLGFGVSAISRLGDCYGQNLKDLPSWEHAVDSRRSPLWRGLALSADDRVRASIIEQLMCHGQIDLFTTEREYGIDFQKYFGDALARLEPLIADGLVTRTGQAITVTETGRLLLRNVAMCFDRYVSAAAESASASRTI
ncbi:MAG: oxygen-independent coproporphyrinogen III oxidase [Proteobacteria bacterium]|nr:oxygen-independent coproporphyrinogen III oxidase [Pseudomonadota bacterium]